MPDNGCCTAPMVTWSEVRHLADSMIMGCCNFPIPSLPVYDLLAALQNSIHWRQHWGWGWSRGLRLLAVSDSCHTHTHTPGLDFSWYLEKELHAEFTEWGFHFSTPFLQSQVLQSMFFIPFSGNNFLLYVFGTDLINQSHSFLNKFTFIPKDILIRQH